MSFIATIMVAGPTDTTTTASAVGTLNNVGNISSASVVGTLPTTQAAVYRFTVNQNSLAGAYSTVDAAFVALVQNYGYQGIESLFLQNPLTALLV